MSLVRALMLLHRSDDIQTLMARKPPVFDIDPLPRDHHRGLIAVAIFALLSLVATLALILFITYRLLFWRGNYARYIGYNQYIILIYNLVIADFLESLGFLLCFKWITSDKITADSAGCFIQGMLLQIGDPSSGLFVFGIAVHTFILVALSHKLSHRNFVMGVVGLWIFIVILFIIPLAIHGRYVFIPSGAWCWINEDYEKLRLWVHYIWIFLSEFGTVCLYAIMWFQLRRRIAQSSILGSSHIESLKRLRRVVGYMVIYPLAYIFLSLPLAAGRMATAQGKTPNVVYFCVAGAVITSSGWVDVLLYTLTRRSLIVDSEPSDDPGSYKFGSRGRKTDNHLTTITADPKTGRGDASALRSRRQADDDDDLNGTTRDGSTDNIVQNSNNLEMAPMGKVYQHTTIEITSEPAYPSEAESSNRSSKDSLRQNGQRADPSSRMWGR